MNIFDDLKLQKPIRRFRRMALATIFLTVFLIWVGGWVRSVGAGMGCPDWPKCFGQWIPPTDAAQLPPDYKDVYANQRRQKNERIATRIEKMGFTSVAERLRNDPKMYIEEDFNTYKTWTEYVNRLIGVLVGFSIFLMLLASFRLQRVSIWLPILAGIGFFLVGFEGWLGSIVVSTRLMPGMITIHMILAMVLLMVLISAILLLEKKLNPNLKIAVPYTFFWSGLAISLVVLWQIGIGTQVRERVDVVSDALGEAQRGTWISQLGSVYQWHQYSFYAVTVAILAWFFALGSHNFGGNSWLRRFSIATVLILGLEIMLGFLMHNFSIPALAQPLHLLLGTLLFATAFSATAIVRIYR